MHRLAVRPTAALLMLALLVAAPMVAGAQGRQMAAGAGEGIIVPFNIICQILAPPCLGSFAFAASSDSDGSNPQGHIRLSELNYDVVCLNVTGNSALIGGLSAEGKTVEIAVADMRETGTPDMFTAYTEVPPDCLGPTPASEVLKGNIMVRDAQ